jgi:hypothetical protein
MQKIRAGSKKINGRLVKWLPQPEKDAPKN